MNQPNMQSDITVGDTVSRNGNVGTVLEVSRWPRRDSANDNAIREDWSPMVRVQWETTTHWEAPELLERVV